MPEDAADVGQEAHVEHPVRLVEDEDLEAGELRVAEPEVVEEAAGRRDDDVDAAPEGVLLGAHPDAAEDGRAGERRVERERLEMLVDLRRQLARGREDERARRAARLRHEAVKDREEERGGLAAARHRAGEDVAALPSRAGWRRSGWAWAGEAHVLDAAEEVGVEVERGKGMRENRFPGRPRGTSVPLDVPAGRERWIAGGAIARTRIPDNEVAGRVRAGTRERARQPKERIACRARRVKRGRSEPTGLASRRRPRAGSKQPPRVFEAGGDSGRRARPARQDEERRRPRGRKNRVRLGREGRVVELLLAVPARMRRHRGREQHHAAGRSRACEAVVQIGPPVTRGEDAAPRPGGRLEKPGEERAERRLGGTRKPEREERRRERAGDGGNEGRRRREK